MIEALHGVIHIRMYENSVRSRISFRIAEKGIFEGRK